MENLKEKRARMSSLVDQWRSSGKSQRLFCIEHGIKLATLSYWVSKVKDQNKIDGVFISVLPQTSAKVIELTYPNGVSLNVGTEDLVLLSHLIHLY